MVTTLYLIRHGATEGSENFRYKGSLDVPLSEEGMRQVEKTARLLRSMKAELKAVYCSDLSRAVRSAEIVSGNLDGSPKPVVVPEFRERGFGLWEGMSFEEICRRYPSEFQAWASDPLRFSPPGGESTLQVAGRAIPALDKTLAAHGGESFAVVAHGGVNRVMLCNFMGMPLENIFRIEQDFAAINIIEINNDYPIVKLINGRP